MAGIRIRDPKARSTVRLVPDLNHYRDKPDLCNYCNVVHFVKTYHLWLDDSGAAIVSPQVLEGLKKAGMGGLEIVDEVKKPPPLTIAANVTREQLDHNNRKIRFLRKKWK